jgi:hypothetical protein
MLFPKHRHTARSHARPVRHVVTIVEEPARLPGYLKRLDLLCPERSVHPLPVKMVFIAESTSAKGQPMAVYACPFAGCQHRQGWVQERGTDRPFRLWAGWHTRP